jgi:hypothetical protein
VKAERSVLNIENDASFLGVLVYLKAPVLALCGVLGLSACTHVRPTSTSAISQSELEVIGDAKGAYQSQRVEETNNFQSKINGQIHDGLSTVDYYAAAGDQPAADLARSSLEMKQKDRTLWIRGALYGAAGGAAVGFIGSSAYVASQNDAAVDEFGFGRAIATVLGVVGGAVIGAITGDVIYYSDRKLMAESQFDKAGLLFNENLRKKLNVQVMPSSNGIKGSVQLNY